MYHSRAVDTEVILSLPIRFSPSLELTEGATRCDKNDHIISASGQIPRSHALQQVDKFAMPLTLKAYRKKEDGLLINPILSQNVYRSCVIQ